MPIRMDLFDHSRAKTLPLKEDVPASPSRIVDWQIIGVVCVGLWGLIRAIPDGMYWAVILQTGLTADYGLTALSITQKSRIAATILELGLALWLVFGARKIATDLFGARVPSHSNKPIVASGKHSLSRILVPVRCAYVCLQHYNLGDRHETRCS